MATIYFLGVNDDWENTDNWSGHALPVDDDDVRIPETARSPLMRHLDRTGDTAGAGLALGSFFVHPNYRHDIGCEGNPLKCIVRTGVSGELSILFRGLGKFYYSAESGTGILSSQDIAICGDPRTSRMILSGDKCDNNPIFVHRGTLELSTACGGIAALWLGHWREGKDGAQLVAHNMGAFAVDELYMGGGRAQISCDITTAHLRGGNLTQSESRISYLHLNGAQCIYNSSDAITAAYVSSGLLDLDCTANEKTISHLYHFGGIIRRSEATAIMAEHQIGLPTTI